MAIKKYLSLEEASAILRIQPDELIRLRERGEIRGFADRGTWKFKSEDVEEYGRSRQADSHPDVPILDDSSSSSDSGMRSLKRTSDSDVRLILDDKLREGSDSDPEVLLSAMGDSDSDVRLADEPRPIVDSGTDSDVKLIGDDSDSDVTLASAQSDKQDDSASDSDVKLIGSDTESDVRLADSALVGDLTGSGSDSDVQLVGGSSDVGFRSSESDIRLTSLDGSSMDVGSGSGSSADALSGSSANDVALAGGSSASGDSSVLAGDDSGVGLDFGSSVVLAGDNSSSSDSGISLQSLADSGISLERADSGIALAGMADSGIALDKIPDSGISLSGPDSGIRLDRGDKGKDVRGTVPMLQMPDGDDDLDDTQMEVAALGDEGDTYSLQGGASKTSDTDADTGVILFDDDEMGEMPSSSGSHKKPGSSAFDMAGSSVDFAEAEDFSDDEDLEVAEDTFAEEDQLDELDVFDAADEDFEETFESGESHAEFTAPVSPGRLAAPAAEADWGTGTFVGLALSTLLMSMCLIVTFDLIRTMWAPLEPTIVSGPILDLLKSVLSS
ncbi:MAG: helix-turn-helix domain-containing protein [Planctomycetaceae bacterium]